MGGSLDQCSSQSLQRFLLVSAYCLILFQVSLREPHQWACILWEAWSTAMYFSYSAIIWVTKLGLEFKPRPLTSYTQVPQLNLSYVVGNFSLIVLSYLQRTLPCILLVSSIWGQWELMVLDISVRDLAFWRITPSMWKHLNVFKLVCKIKVFQEQLQKTLHKICVACCPLFYTTLFLTVYSGTWL